MGEFFYKVDWEAVERNKLVDSGTYYFRTSDPATSEDFRTSIARQIQRPASAIFLPTFGPVSKAVFEANGGDADMPFGAGPKP